MNYLLFVFAIAGVVLHLLFNYYNSITVKKTKQFNWKENLTYTIISLIVICVLLFTGDESGFFNMIGLQLNHWTAFLLGAFSDSVIKNFSSFDPFKTKK